MDQPFGCTGADLDTTGLYKMGARCFDPGLGRFTQPDPSGQENNAFLYAAGDPVHRMDPTGLFSWDVALGSGVGGPLIGGAVGGYSAAAVGDVIAGASGGDVAKSCVFGAIGGALVVAVAGLTKGMKRICAR
ncbi:RHS repeat-associated core domain-containing protein [Streptomyces griseoluteus]|uniref:RHS repeat-associated core domain-containing protein n=1 Tax=Streptomyces griseoluteus TaxID=29306 RepID=UPI0036F8F2A3